MVNSRYMSQLRFKRLSVLAVLLLPAALLSPANAGQFEMLMTRGPIPYLQGQPLTKAEVRQLARQRGLPTADLPSMACLASRVPYGRRITGETLHQIAEAEAFLLQLGLVQVRVRHHGEIARIEVAPEQLDVLTAEPVRTQVVNRLVALGFRYCTVDLLGYRSGSMNEVLTEEGVAGDQL
jgi:PP-loop superfamily ATP-utilizing enzyme